MKAQLNAITIAVKNLPMLKKFYIDVFGWDILDENPEIVMFKLDRMVLSLYQDKSLANYIGALDEQPTAPKSYLTINTPSHRHTDELFHYFKQMGVNIIKMPELVFWGGYSGIIADPENNHWEICYNPNAR
jgi:predicted enzyme related to lactoylglutathione lyase